MENQKTDQQQKTQGTTTKGNDNKDKTQTKDNKILSLKAGILDHSSFKGTGIPSKKLYDDPTDLDDDPLATLGLVSDIGASSF